MNKEVTTDTPRTDDAMSLKQNYDLSEKDCPVYENYVHAEVCAEIERELAEAKAEVEFYKKSVKAYVHACEPIRGMADKLGLRLGMCIIQHGVPLLLDSHKKAEAECAKWRKIAESLTHKPNVKLDQRKFGKQDWWNKKLANDN